MKRLKYFWAILIMVLLNIYEGFAINVNYSSTEFFVNCAKTVSGSGTSWSDALNTETFTEVLSKVNHPCTFYLAEGLYCPKSPVGTTLNTAFVVSSGVTIRGGYSPSQQSLSVPSGKETVFSCDFANSELLFSARLQGSDPISVYDVHFKGVPNTSSVYAFITNSVSVSSSTGSASPFRFERCVFSDFINVQINNSFGSFVDCDFCFDGGCTMTVTGSATREPLNIISSSFTGAKCLTFCANNALKISNCLFAGLNGTPVADDILHISQVSDVIDYNSRPSIFSVLSYNTILGNVLLENMYVTLSGNFIHGKLVKKNCLNPDGYCSSVNMVVNVTSGTDDSDNRNIDISSLSKFFHFKNGIYELTDVNGKPTKTIALLTDHICINNLSSDIAISFRNENQTLLPKEDISGNERYSYACFGACEFPFNGQKNYYVKVDGTGDGSSWNKAMGLSDFSYYFYFAPNHSTFHLAEGRYNSNSFLFMEFPTSIFVTKQYVNLIGGYPKDSKNGAKPNPSRYHTIFDGNTGNDVESEISDSNKKTFLVCYQQLIGCEDFVVRGLEFVNQYNSDKVSTGSALNFVTSSDVIDGIRNGGVKVEQCSFSRCTNAVYCSNMSLDLKDCFFQNIMEHAVSLLSRNRLNVESCTFHECATGIHSLSINDRIVNSTFVGNDQALYLIQDDAHGSELVAKLDCNTIMDKIWYGNQSSTSRVFLTGNILSDDISILSGILFSQHNLFVLKDYPLSSYDWSTSSDKYLSSSNFNTLADCELDAGLYVPVLKYGQGKESVAPVIPLLTDTLPDGESILFPLSLVSVTEDQRGLKRGNKTCVGACEIGTYSADDIDIPTAFTPYSKNGKNDIFMAGREVYIYNRYGLLLCHSYDGWDGYYRDELVEPGVYVYVVVTKSESHKGTVEVVKSK